MRRRKVSADTLVWMFHEELREKFSNLKHLILAVVPDGRYGWAVIVKRQRRSNRDVVAFVRRVEDKFKEEYALEH